MLVIIYTFFDMRYQKNLTNSQPIKVEIKLDGVVPNDFNWLCSSINKQISFYKQ